MTVSRIHIGLFIGVLGALVGLLLLIVPQKSFAQSAYSSAEIDMRPQYPAPGETVRVMLKTSGFSMHTSLITWTIDGEVAAQDYGLDRLEMTAGPVGTEHSIVVTIESQDGSVLRAASYHTVGAIDFVWEADTYTPPFFAGRPLHTKGAGVTVLAIPTLFKNDGTLYSPDELFYKWSFPAFDDDVRKHGRGLSALHVQDERSYGTHRFTVEISNSAGTVLAENTLNIPSSAPQVHFYADSPLMGVLYGSALPTKYMLTGDEIRLVAEPYYVSAENRVDPALEYEWKVGQDKLETAGSVVLRPEGVGAGTAPVSVKVWNSAHILQSGSAAMHIEYSGTDDTSNTETL